MMALAAGELPLAAPITTLAVLLELAVGTVVVCYLLDLVGRVGRGYVASTTLISAAAFGLALLLLLGIGGDPSALRSTGAAMQGLWHASLAFLGAMLLLALFCGIGTDAARRVVGAGTAALGVMVIISAGNVLQGYASSPVIALLAGSAFVAGSVVAGMLLGHWYLIAPDLSFRPLRLAVYTIFTAIGVQAAIVAGITLSAPAAPRQALFAGSNAILFWLLVVGSGIVFSAGVNILTWHFTRIRANQPATAMLYVLIVSVAMAIIPAHLLFFSTGIAL